MGILLGNDRCVNSFGAVSLAFLLTTRPGAVMLEIRPFVGRLGSMEKRSAMHRVGVMGMLLGLTLSSAALGQGGGTQSGLLPPAKMPHAFDVYTFNGKNAERFHCLVCENDINPTLLLFLKEPADGKGKAIEALFAKLDDLLEKYQAMEKYPDVANFAVYAVFLSPAAQTSLNNPKEPDAAKLVKEATDRRALYQRMKEWAGKVKKVVVACAIPEAAKGYKINAAANVTGIYYDSLDVQENFAFDEFSESNVNTIVAGVETRLQAKIAAFEAKKNKPLRVKNKVT